MASQKLVTGSGDSFDSLVQQTENHSYLFIHHLTIDYDYKASGSNLSQDLVTVLTQSCNKQDKPIVISIVIAILTMDTPLDSSDSLVPSSCINLCS